METLQLIPNVFYLKAEFPGYCAALIDSDGMITDLCGNWETAQSMANSETYMIVFNGDGHMTESELRAMVKYEREINSDCFGYTLPDSDTLTIAGIDPLLASALGRV